MSMAALPDDALHGHLPAPNKNDDDSISCRWEQVVMHGLSWWGEVMELGAKLFEEKPHLRS